MDCNERRRSRRESAISAVDLDVEKRVTIRALGAVPGRVMEGQLLYFRMTRHPVDGNTLGLTLPCVGGWPMSSRKRTCGGQTNSGAGHRHSANLVGASSVLPFVGCSESEQRQRNRRRSSPSRVRHPPPHPVSFISRGRVAHRYRLAMPVGGLDQELKRGSPRLARSYLLATSARGAHTQSRAAERERGAEKRGDRGEPICRHSIARC